ncbi:hypothetical protein NDN08_004477 [Rhodosorus marinus]|uniref:Uncharacterized protein n=1 Tax=Rhodosorus marinus TaxID=101924 RepID=A0AAV8UMW0_9RHOD|nr:hypothetical protein NDN08_004477 [Rhodosorus marinus]
MNCSIRMLNEDTKLRNQDRVFYFQVWSGLLVESMHVTNIPVFKEDIDRLLQLGNRFSEDRRMENRKAAGRIYGAACTACDRKLAESEILQRVLKLSYDKDVIVLGTAIEAMVMLAESIGLNTIQGVLWPRILKTINAGDVRVRCTALRTVATILQNIRDRNLASDADSLFFRKSVASLLVAEADMIVRDAKEDLRNVPDEIYMTLEVQSEILGELLYTAVDALDPQSTVDVYHAYISLASCNGPLLRRNVAYNFPGFSKCMSGKYGDLGAVFTLLCHDRDDEVRWKVSAGLHESLKILLKDPMVDSAAAGKCVVTLLTDENLAVSGNVVEHLEELIKSFREENLDDHVNLLLTGLSQLEGMVDGSWRLQEMICEQLKNCITLFDGPTIAGVILPLLWNLTQQGMPPVRESAAETIMHCLRNIDDKDLLNFSVKKFYIRLGSFENPYRIRLNLLDAAVEGTRIFSSVFFREFFCQAVVDLAEDPLSNVRLKIARHVPELMPVCGTVPEFKSMLRELQKDKDQDVSTAIKSMGNPLGGKVGQWQTPEWIARDRQKLKEERLFFTRELERNSPAKDGGLGTGRNGSIRGVGGVRKQSQSGRNSASPQKETAAEESDAAFISSLRSGPHKSRDAVPSAVDRDLNSGQVSVDEDQQPLPITKSFMRLWGKG